MLLALSRGDFGPCGHDSQVRRDIGHALAEPALDLLLGSLGSRLAGLLSLGQRLAGQFLQAGLTARALFGLG